MNEREQLVAESWASAIALARALARDDGDAAMVLAKYPTDARLFLAQFSMIMLPLMQAVPAPIADRILALAEEMGPQDFPE